MGPVGMPVLLAADAQSETDKNVCPTTDSSRNSPGDKAIAVFVCVARD
jgi:hypothetical protein